MTTVEITDPTVRVFILLLLFVPSTQSATDDSSYSLPFKARDDILLNCGSSGLSEGPDGREWLGDVGSKYNPALTSVGSTTPALDSSAPRIPYLTGRVFPYPSTYFFPLIGPGRIFIRLHFYPSNYADLDATDALFSVSAGPITLLSNFSAYQTSRALNLAYLVHEYSVDVASAWRSSTLELTFTPSEDYSNAYAYVNGIEILSIPDLLGTMGTPGPVLVNGGPPTPYSIEPEWAFQTVYRLNVGGQAISPAGDTAGLFRSWVDDSVYVLGAAYGVSYSADPNVTIGYNVKVPAYIAPNGVYSTARSMGRYPQVNRNYNLTWILPVDAGFYYLVRLHFCEILYPITQENMRVFTIYLNNQTAQQKFDVIAKSGGIGKPYFADYVVVTTGTGMADLWVALHPNERSKPVYVDALLNGLEVFKLESNGKLNNGPIPKFVPKKGKSNAGAFASGVEYGGAALLVGFFFMFVVCKKKLMKRKRENDAGSRDGPAIIR